MTEKIIQPLLLATLQMQLRLSLQHTQQTLNITPVMHHPVTVLIRISCTTVMNHHLQPIQVSVTKVINLLWQPNPKTCQPRRIVHYQRVLFLKGVIVHTCLFPV